MTGALRGYRVVELAGIGPGPFAAMMLSDMGAEVLRVDRADAVGLDAPLWDVNARGRRSVGIDLKHPDGREAVLRLVERADVLIEGFRPGVTERLGLGPDDCLARQPRLVYGRMTGWGQDGPYAQAPGRDINYVALSGTLGMIGPAGAPPVPPLNVVGDFGGGGLLLAFGIVCALLEAGGSGRGQVVDAAMVDGAALLAGMIHGLRAAGDWGGRGTNLLDGGAWFYDAYETADGKYVSVGAIDPRARRQLAELTGVDPGPDDDRSSWPDTKARLAAAIRARTRDEWCAALEGTDVCFAPVLDPDEAPAHPHNRHRGTFTEVGGVVQPAPAPRFSRTPPAVAGPPPAPGQHTDEALADWGFSAQEVSHLRTAVAVR
ncbi:MULTISPECIES: CaiB/BaiF CoA-transferase family protein [unclassified Pseudofrankia]|uniref:CaiB/BaiF CoA transferase family protein n=1 Tax=unclassified Pseudofrankia TaxID=2994372 RepID=UPI0008D9CAF2|nr:MULTISPECIES: CaiB/BaiF CoA-transferase family protein [unclassified Pseudofrankia]MDT3443271.1 CaiB/BaiF CoA-transferase family protein [Pseudofrankia sp. BMG5.37]OHV65385.1 carnitine dehydratase [Pseudofrankia sp. BMG5.36]